MRPFERARRPHRRAGKRPLLVPEEGALHQALGHGRAVDGDERGLVPLALVVNRSGKEFLPGPRLALQTKPVALVGATAAMTSITRRNGSLSPINVRVARSFNSSRR